MLRVGWHFCEPRDPQAKGGVERLQDFLERSFESGRSFANELDFQLQIDDCFDTRANPRVHKTLRCRPIDRLREERSMMAPLPATAPDTDRRWVLRVPPDPYLVPGAQGAGGGQGAAQAPRPRPRRGVVV